MELDISGAQFTVEEGKTGPALFVLGVRKSGSTMLNNACHMLAQANAVNFVDVAAPLFRANVPAGAWAREKHINRIVFPGNAYGGFRVYPSGLRENRRFRLGKKILLVRDPRDALVSEYFSNAYSHRIPKASGEIGVRERLLVQREKALSTSVDAYVLERAELMRRTIAAYEEILEDQGFLLLRYEDIIFAKEKMLRDVAAHFRWQCAADQLAEILSRIDVRPEVERQTEFIRKVTPGDHREKLSSATIGQLNDKFAGVMSRLGYTA